MLTSARRGISYPNPDRSDRPDIPAHLLNFLNALEVDMIYVQGTDAARVARAHMAGTFFYATDTTVSWYDDGAAWHQVGVTASGIHLTGVASGRPAANTVPAGTLYRETDTGLVKYSDGAAWTLWSAQAGMEWDYKQVTADVTGLNATTEASPNVLVTGNSFTPDGGKVKIEAYVPGISPLGGSGASVMILGIQKDGSSILDTYSEGWATAGGQSAPPVVVAGFDTPTAAAHVYRLVIWFPGATGPNLTARAGAGGSGVTQPMWMRVSKA